MAKKKSKKEECPECCVFTVKFTKLNCEYIWQKQIDFKKAKHRHRKFEQVVNDIIALQAIKDDHKI